jgi:chromosome segregation ATPase
MAITKDDIFNAADELVAEGKNPTQLLIRERLGGGSFSTIHNYMKQWRDAQKEENKLVDVEVPDDLESKAEQMIKELWFYAVEKSEDSLKIEKQLLEEAQKAAGKEVEDAENVIKVIEKEKEDLEVLLNSAETEIADLKSKIELMLKNKNELLSEIQSLKVRIETTESINNKLVSSLNSTEDDTNYAEKTAFFLKNQG